MTSGRVQLIIRQRGAGLKVQIELQAVDVDGIPRDSGAAIASWHFIDIDGEHLWELSDCFVLNLYPLPDAPQLSGRLWRVSQANHRPTVGSASPIA